jgi:hypothetical protein
MTKVRAARYVECPFSAALEFAEKAARRRDGLYVTPSPPLGERVQVAVTTTDDSTDEARKHDALLIAWRAQTKGVFPDFHGVLTVRPRHRGVSLRLDGQYEPPYGAAGKAFDLVAGRAIAIQTMRHFLNDLAADIEAEYAKECEQSRTSATRGDGV